MIKYVGNIHQSNLHDSVKMTKRNNLDKKIKGIYVSINPLQKNLIAYLGFAVVVGVFVVAGVFATGVAGLIVSVPFISMASKLPLAKAKLGNTSKALLK